MNPSQYVLERDKWARESDEHLLQISRGENGVGDDANRGRLRQGTLHVEGLRDSGGNEPMTS